MTILAGCQIGTEAAPWDQRPDLADGSSRRALLGRVDAPVVRRVGPGLGIGGKDKEAAPLSAGAVGIGNSSLLAFQLFSPGEEVYLGCRLNH